MSKETGDTGSSGGQKKFFYSRRANRLDKKFKGTLRCEWCNRNTPIKPPQDFKKNKLTWGDYSLRDWRQFKKGYKAFYCKREKCIQARSAYETDNLVLETVRTSSFSRN